MLFLSCNVKGADLVFTLLLLLFLFSFVGLFFFFPFFQFSVINTFLSVYAVFFSLSGVALRMLVLLPLPCSHAAVPVDPGEPRTCAELMAYINESVR